MTSLHPRPLLIVISGPSGTGKTTLCDKLVAEMSSVRYSVSCTTRQPREGEVDGQSYHFLDDATFAAQVEQGAFLEHASVHGCRYGTLRETVYAGLEEGHDVLMDIDVQGAAKIRSYIQAAPAGDPLKRSFVDVFVGPPSLEALRDRLEARGKDTDEVINRRMVVAETEIQRHPEYRYFIVNDQLDDSYSVLRAIVVAEHHRIKVRSKSGV